MRDFRRLLSLGVGGGLFVLLAGADGTCGAGSGVATCTKDAVTVLLNPGECTPIPSCAQGGYFDAASWSVAFAQTTPDWLTLGFDTLDFLGKPVANVCAGNGAPRGTDLNLKIAGTASGREANTEIKVHIRSTSSMDVQLKVPGAPIVNGRTLVSSGENTPVVAVAMTGSLLGREGDWNLGEATATAGPATNASTLDGMIMTPANTGLGDLVLRLDDPVTKMPGDDVFSLPVRLMRFGDAAVTIRQLESSYRGGKCAGMNAAPTNCLSTILCFTLEGTVLGWPVGSMTSNSISYTSAPVEAGVGNSLVAFPLFAVCAEGIETVTPIVFTETNAELDRTTLVVHQ